MSTKLHNSPAEQLEAYRRMVTIRRFERRAEQFMDSGIMLGSMHSSAGQEAVSVGACTALRDDDYMTGHHRSHAHPIAKGVDLNRLMAELLGRRDGVSRGNGGSMHLADASRGHLGESAIVGSSLPIAAGAGLAIVSQGSDRVCLSFFGDGAANAGIFHETLNYAAIWRLPVVFVCENNLYAMTTPHHTVCAVDQIADRASSYGIPGVVVDGQDVFAVHDATATAVARARSGEGPTLIEAMTYRYGDHSYFLRDLGGPRAAEEVAHWTSRDPIAILRSKLTEAGHPDAELDEIDRQVDEAIRAAADFALASPPPELDDLRTAMYADVSPWRGRDLL